MALAMDYASVMGRANEIMKQSLGLDYRNSNQAPSPSIMKR